MSDPTVAETLTAFGRFLRTPAGAAYLRRRFVPSAYVQLVAWLRDRAPFNHTRLP